MRKLKNIAVTFFAGGGLFVGLPLIAWGPGDLSRYFADTFRSGYVILALMLNGFAAVRSPEFGKPRTTPRTSFSRQHVVVVFLQILSLLIVIVGPYSDAREIAGLPGDGTFRLCGLLLYGAGFLLMHFAQMALGKQFSVEVAIQESHSLITTGLYSRIRHPRYLGITLFTTGISLVFGSLIDVILSAVGVFVLLWRIRDEEALMLREFGENWKRYAGRSWRLVPYIF